MSHSSMKNPASFITNDSDIYPISYNAFIWVIKRLEVPLRPSNHDPEYF